MNVGKTLELLSCYDKVEAEYRKGGDIMLYINSEFTGRTALFGRIAKALSYLYTGEPGKNPVGRYDYEDGMYFLVQEYETKDPKGLPYEAHRKYVDIQFVVSGEERIGVAPIGELMEITQEYTPEKDVLFGTAPTGKLLPMSAGSAFVLLPEDAHLPQADPADGVKGHVKKIVFKVPVL